MTTLLLALHLFAADTTGQSIPSNNEDRPTYYIGWMSSRFVEKLP